MKVWKYLLPLEILFLAVCSFIFVSNASAGLKGCWMFKGKVTATAQIPGDTVKIKMPAVEEICFKSRRVFKDSDGLRGKWRQTGKIFRVEYNIGKVERLLEKYLKDILPDITYDITIEKAYATGKVTKKKLKGIKYYLQGEATAFGFGDVVFMTLKETGKGTGYKVLKSNSDCKSFSGAVSISNNKNQSSNDISPIIESIADSMAELLRNDISPIIESIADSMAELLRAKGIR